MDAKPHEPPANGEGVPVEMTPKMRSSHLYICGSTGTGKSKMLEHLIQQDISQWQQNHCGMLVIDPHGSLYDSVMNWVAWNAPYLKNLPIVPIDLRRSDWTVGYNVLRQRHDAEPDVVVRNFVQAMAYVWGVSGIEGTPLFARWASHVLWTLYEKRLTLIEAEDLLSPTAKEARNALTENVSRRAGADEGVRG